MNKRKHDYMALIANPSNDIHMYENAIRYYRSRDEKRKVRIFVDLRAKLFPRNKKGGVTLDTTNNCLSCIHCLPDTRPEVRGKARCMNRDSIKFEMNVTNKETCKRRVERKKK